MKRLIGIVIVVLGLTLLERHLTLSAENEYNLISEGQIKWQVLAGGGASGASTSFRLGSTLGQTAVGPGSSTGVHLHQGYWQHFCCVGTTGNVNMSGIVDLGDLALIVAYLTNSPATKPKLPCPEEANVNGQGIIDLGDLALLVAYLTNSPAQKPALPDCR